jgi:hypothetical protein
LVAALACAIRPALLGWAAVGLAVAIVFGLRGVSRRRGAAVVSGILAAGTIVACGSSGSAGSAATIELGGHLIAVAKYQEASRAFSISESLTIEEATLRQASTSRLVPLGQPERAEEEIVDAVRGTLTRAGWRVWLSTKAVRATYEATSAVRQHEFFPGLTANSLQLASLRYLGSVQRLLGSGPMPNGEPPGRPRALPIALTLDSSSGVTLKAPNLLVAATDPASSAQQVAGHEEERQLKLGEEGTLVKYETRSSIFRHEVLSMIPSLTLWSGFKWLLLGIAALAGEEFRNAVKRLTRRLRPGSRDRSA